VSERIATESVRRLLAAATPGPWTHEHIGFGGHEVEMSARGGVFVEDGDNARLIAAAPDLAADLLDARAAVALAHSYRAAVIAERDAETAHTNAGPGARQPAMAAMLAARGVRTTAEARLGAALDGGR